MTVDEIAWELCKDSLEDKFRHWNEVPDFVKNEFRREAIQLKEEIENDNK